MSSPNSRSTGSLSTDGNPYTTAGLLHYAQASGGVLTVYDGSTSGNLLCTVGDGARTMFTTPVAFGSSGVHVQISAGSAVIHIS